MIKKGYLKKLATLVLIVYSFFLLRPFVPQVQADALTEASMRLDRMKTSEVDVQILVVAKIPSTASEGKVVVTFDNAFTVDSTPANITATATGIPSTYQGESLVGWPTISATATAVVGNVVTFTCGDMTPTTTLYGFYITAGIDNPSSANTYINTIATTTSGDTPIDSKSVAVDVVTNDQVTVTASVPSSFNFALSGNTIALGAQSVSAVDTGNVTIDVDTNAASGYMTWVKSTNTYLLSSSTSDQINTQGTVNGTPDTCSAGSECYQLDVQGTTDDGGSITINAEYDGNGTTTGGTFTTAFQEVMYNNGAALDDTVTLTVLVAISALNKAATDYTDTLTVIGAGNF